MQISRTSLRHLRLSKLQKEKVLQGKMWDFTVRGWRVADIRGIENQFNDEEAAKPQKAVKELKYKDTKIETHDELNKMWKLYQDRNLLRKLDIALNSVGLSSAEIQSSTSDELEEIANGNAREPNQSQQEPRRQYVITVPPVEKDFPDLVGKPTKIFPLPISHENQCKTVGLASNLDLFTKEFGFQSKKETKYVPLRSTGQDFALDKAYERFAFMKSLERHKEHQKEYENILRGESARETATMSEESVSSSNANNLFVVMDDEESSSEEEN